jgi:hypothetical protein
LLCHRRGEKQQNDKQMFHWLKSESFTTETQG